MFTKLFLFYFFFKNQSKHFGKVNLELFKEIVSSDKIQGIHASNI